MNPTIKKIENILTSQYNITNYTDFIREIFPTVQIIAPDRFNKEYTNFSSHIEGSSHVGNYTDSDGKTMIIFAVQLKKESYVENSRSTQRSYAKKLIEAGNADAAIVAFYTEGDPKWRLSFVRLDYEIKFENGKLNTTENITPAKRYSYLVGQDEPCHTAISRFRRFIIDDPNVARPSLDELEEAFSVEKVTEEFFTLYCEKFHQLRESLEANPDFVIEAEQHNFTSAQFAKKLMGQIVFLYFLQKKGWLGVSAWPRTMNAKEYKKAFFARGAKSRELIPRVYVQVAEDQYKLSGKALDELSDEDETVLASCVKGNAWGTGSKTFMRTLFEFSQRREANFFDDFLEPLFYDALNVNRGEQGYDPALHCRIPFLSGGLFEPIDGYDWEHNYFAIPDEIFSNKAEKGERDADGILDIFDRYNFTMSEDEPLEREVAIDPEMLGKVFENLLEVKDRKSKGAFYTPREIVHYMCQETLISYLIKETGLKEQDIRDFVLLGDFLKDEDTAKNRRQGKYNMLISEEIYKIDHNGNVVVDRLKDIDYALANIRVADPAVGSGAFPLGMLNEIVRARQNISAYMAITMNAYQIRNMYNNERSPYSLKLQTIKNCIFAADIEPSAVDIAQLRLWLSLVIDDEINPDAQNPLDGHRNPTPLPNLECNIVCGNSLIDEFKGIKLINFNDTIGTSKRNQQHNLFQNAFDAMLPLLLEAQDALFRCDDTVKKQELKERIESLKDEIIKSQMQMASQEVLDSYLEARREASKPFVLWQIDFARVFSEKGGFDIVIGNPPYIDSETMVNTGLLDERDYISSHYKYAKGNWDIYIAFFEKGLSLLEKNGTLMYITPDKWISKPFGDKLRIGEINNITKILVAGRKVFESALVDSIITQFSLKGSNVIDVYSMKTRKDPIVFERTVQKNILSSPFALDIIFSDAISLITKMEKIGDKLGNHYECENACATSDCYTLKEILKSLDNESEYSDEYYKVINTGTIGRYVSRWGKASMKYLKDRYDFPVTTVDAFHSTFPNSYGAKACKKKVIIKGLTLLDASIDMKGIIIPGKSTEIICCEDINELKILCAYINSKVSIFYIKQKYSSSSYNGGINFTKKMINDLPWVVLSDDEKMIVIDLVDRIIALKEDDIEADTKELESQIDDLFISKFGFTNEEIEIILAD